MSRTGHTKYLKVCKPDGSRIELKVFVRQDNKLLLSIEYLDAVAEDKPDFANNGQIKMVIYKAAYEQTIERLESYLESLFLKELSNEPADTSS